MTVGVQQTVVMAGGRATRMQSVFPGLAKACYRLNNRPVLLHLFDWIEMHGFRSVHLCLGHLSDQVLEIMPKRPPFALSWTIEREPLGVGGALLGSLELLEPQFLLLYGDVIPQIDPKKTADAFLRSSNLIQLTAAAKSDVFEPCNLTLSTTNQVKHYGQSTEATHLDVGVTFVNKRILLDLPPDVYGSLTPIFNRAIQSDKMGAWETNCASLEVGSLAGYRRARQVLGRHSGC
jgi:NDP-sugar pyrophosphorylase family protein